MHIGAITGYIDVAQVALYGFWVFFIGLLIYLRREDKREGYPLHNDRGRVQVQGFPAVPAPKAFRLADGRTVIAPDPAKDAAPPSTTGNIMLDGVGPGAYGLRAKHPERTLEGLPLIVPLRAAPGFSVASGDPDPRGKTVYGADRQAGGTVTDLWVDRAEPIVRYLEVEVSGQANTVLVPMPMARVESRRVLVRSILGSQFAAVPRIASPDEVTLDEEDRIAAYFAAGTLYAEPSRAEPLL